MGSVISARPTSTSRHWPRLSRSIGSSARSARPRSSSTSSHRAISSAVAAARARAGPSRAGRGRRRTRSAMKRWSRTVESGNSSMRWNVRPIPSRARSWTGRPVMSSPSSSTVPRSVRSHAEHAVEERRLAGAVRADQPDPLALVDVDADVVERDDAGEPLGARRGPRSSALIPPAPRCGRRARGPSANPGVARRSRATPALGAWPRRSALAVLDEALGVAGELDGAEPEEHEQPLRRDREEAGDRGPGSRRIQPRNAPLRITASNSDEGGARRSTAPCDGAGAERHDEDDPEQADERREVGAVVDVLLLHGEQRAAERRR